MMKTLISLACVAFLTVVQSSLLKSCDILDPKELKEYVNKSAVSGEENLSHSIANTIGPHLGVAIIIPFKEAAKNHSIYSLAINEYYARRNGYALRIVDDYVDDNKVGDFRITWNAVKHLRDALTTWAKNYEYVLYMEADVIPLDMKYRLEELAVRYKKSNMIFVAGGVIAGTKVGTDWILVRNNVWTMDVLDDWWNYRDRSTMSDVDVFEEYYKMHEDELSDYVTVMSVNTLKNDYPAMLKLWKNNYFLQFPLEVSQYKKIIYEDVLDTICDNVKPNPRDETYPHQLGLTKEKLLMLSTEVYRDLWEEKYQAFEAKAEKGENTYAENQQLMTLTYHLGHSLDSQIAAEQEDAPRTSPEANRVRGKSFKQMYLNLKRHRANIAKNGESAKKIAENNAEFAPLLKTVLKTGQDFIAKMPETFKEKKIVIKIVRDILEDLLDIQEKDPETQEALVNMNVDMGMINMNEKKYEAALADFLAGLRIARKVGAVIGDLVVLAPASQAADAMVLLERYEEAVVLYLHVVQLAEKHHGAEDLTTAYIKVQAAMANEYFKKFKKAHKLIESAIDILQMHPPEAVPQNIYDAALEIYARTKNKRDEDFEKDL
jgi:hypothetical protein